MPNNQWGDFQTPRALADRVLDALPLLPWARVLEPTCGEGSFLAATQRFPDVERVGIEIDPVYAEHARACDSRVITANIFDLHLGHEIPWSTAGPLLVVGNPPWVTNAELGALGSINLPRKSNIRRLKGIDALTGASNFDIAEFILLKLIVELADEEPTLALLCKTQVARNVIEYCRRVGIILTGSHIRRVDAKKWFGASVDACLFITAVSNAPTDWTVPVFPDLDSTQPDHRFGFAAGRLVADLDAYTRGAFADGSCPFEWRQGVKHDASGVMELRTPTTGAYTTRAGYTVELEDSWIYPLLKATDLHHGRAVSDRAVIVTQRSLGDDTSALRTSAPALWSYLESHAHVLDSRKSSIYRCRPRFAMFGIGDYTFAPWKVAVSGLHAAANFLLVGPTGDRPVVLDDTCYLLPFSDGKTAAMTAALLQSEPVADLLRSLMFSDSKRPVTKKLLQRIDLAAVAGVLSDSAIAKMATQILGATVAPDDFAAYRTAHLSSIQLTLSA